MNTDILSAVLREVRLTGAIFFDVEATSPWVAEAPASQAIAPLVMPDSEHVIEYHVITGGGAWASLVDCDEKPVFLEPGSIIMFPHGDPHVLSSEPGMRAEPNYEIFEQPEELSPPYYVQNFGGGAEKTTMICGFLGCDLLPFNPVVQALPRMIHLANGYTNENWLSVLIEGIMKETREHRAGKDNILSRLSELIFIEVLRSHIENLSPGTNGWLAALADRHVGKVIRLFHTHPASPWTLEELAREVGLSRTVLVNRFRDHLGVPPITYLCNWRMQLAAGRLSSGATTIASIAEEVGYESEAAFSRTFKRSTGVSPGAWRSKYNRSRQGKDMNSSKGLKGLKGS